MPRSSNPRVPRAGLLTLLALLSAACQQSQVHPGPSTEIADAGRRPTVGTDADIDVDADTDAAPPALDAFTLPTDVPMGEAGATPVAGTVVYAQSGSDLFKVDPLTLAVSRVGNLVEMNADGTMSYLNDVTDIAVDRQGKIVGVRALSPVVGGELISIDSTTAVCTRLAGLPQGSTFNGLSWIRSDQGTETLVATSNEGPVVRIDPSTGAVTPIGMLGNGLRSSGDLVSVASYGTLITVKQTGMDDDLLAKLDTTTGAATIIGPTGFRDIYGLGFWGDHVFGFTDAGEFVLLDPKTGMGKLVQKDGAYPFWGAGVTTSVPVKID